MRPMQPSLIARAAIEAPRAGTQFQGGDLVEDGFGSARDGRGYVSAYAYAYESARLAL